MKWLKDVLKWSGLWVLWNLDWVAMVGLIFFAYWLGYSLGVGDLQ